VSGDRGVGVGGGTPELEKTHLNSEWVLEFFA
jgi:hypothetical protein